MQHVMKLQNKPFRKIKDGFKTIEMRLNDEKRKQISIGDNIEFTNIDTDEKLRCRVLNLYAYNNFEELYKNHNKISIGYEENETANPEDMKKYYDEDKISENGVLAIQIKLIDSSADIRIDNVFGKYKHRVGIILKKDDSILCLKALKFSGYVLPGGHVELGELSSDTIHREALEELETDVVVKSLFCVHENMYIKDNNIFNEICFYYLCEPLKKLPDDKFEVTEIDKGVKKSHVYEWIKIEELKNKNVKPVKIVEQIIKNINSINNVIISKE